MVKKCQNPKKKGIISKAGGKITRTFGEARQEQLKAARCIAEHSTLKAENERMKSRLISKDATAYIIILLCTIIQESRFI